MSWLSAVSSARTRSRFLDRDKVRKKEREFRENWWKRAEYWRESVCVWEMCSELSVYWRESNEFFNLFSASARGDQLLDIG